MMYPKGNDKFKKASWPKFCNIIFLFMLKIGLVGSVDQQINLILPNVNCKNLGLSLRLQEKSSTRTALLTYWFVSLFINFLKISC